MKKSIFVLFISALLLLSGCAQEAPSAPEPQPPQKAVQSPAPIMESSIYISELMSSNKCSFADEEGIYHDWLELFNAGNEAENLSGLFISCDGERWALPALSLEAGEHFLLICSGDEAVVSGRYHSPFKLSKEGCLLRIEDEFGNCLQELQVPALEVDYALHIESDGSQSADMFPSPGYESYEQFQASLETHSPLIISEAAVYNVDNPTAYLQYYDWVELKNVSDSSILLSDYYLSDNDSKLQKFHLPKVELDSGEHYLVYCDSETENSLNAPFSLNAEAESLYLSDGEKICDSVFLHDIPYKGSMGRTAGENGFFYFTESSPGKENPAGLRMRAEKPRLIGSDGIFNNVESVSVQLQGSGEIYYSTDGSLPNSDSQLYTGAFTVDHSCVVRAVSIADGKLPSLSLDLSYIINENHSLPVMSIASDPKQFFGGSGIYYNPDLDMEISGSAMFYEDSGRFSTGCGIKLHGATSKLNQQKKSLKLCFRGCYEDRLSYDLFENGATEFADIILRAAQEDHYSSLMRDNIMHQLSLEAFPMLPAQDYKYCVLYINGEYWGVYNIRESHSETHYAQHFGIDEDNVSQHKKSWDNTGFDEIYRFALSHDLRKSENYSYVAEHLDIDSVIAWTVIQAYSGNIDLHPPNMRFYYREDIDRLSYALVDLDLGLHDYYAFDVPLDGAYKFTALVNRLLTNKQFEAQLISETERVLSGPMSDENVHLLIDSLANEIRPEIQRDAVRWSYPTKSWEKMVKQLHSYVDKFDGRAAFVANDLRYKVSIPKKEFNEIFKNII